MIIDWVHKSCLIVCMSERTHAQSWSLCRSSSSSFTGPQCRPFTSTVRLLNLHWQPANTQHFQQPLLSASSNNTHLRVSDDTHSLIRMHIYVRMCAQPWLIHYYRSDRFWTWQRASNCLLVPQRPWASTNAPPVFLKATPWSMSALCCCSISKLLFNMIIIYASCIVCSPSPY